MSTSLSPLEQLEQQSKQAQPSTQAAPASNLSPLEQLEQQSAQTQQATPSGMGAAAISSPDTISTGPEGSNSDQQLMSEASQKSATQGGLIATAGGAAGLFAAPYLPEIIALTKTPMGKMLLEKAAAGGAHALGAGAMYTIAKKLGWL